MSSKVQNKNYDKNGMPIYPVLVEAVNKVETKVEALKPNEEALAHEPSQKIVYAFDPETKVYTGNVTAFECPIEKGVFNMPAYTTDAEPLPPRGEDLVFFNGTGWEYLEVIANTEEEVLPTTEELAAAARNKRNSLLAASDYTQLQDYTGDLKKAQSYRQALRDLPKQKGFPTKIEWPTHD